ncbi:S8 family peptidase [Arcobacter sp. YIC-464]|uniref:S8 family peptidase n=1 Tax=Arcobacter sp. YIC-464 TaxID=3376631 RepID=UPI003C2807FC
MFKIIFILCTIFSITYATTCINNFNNKVCKNFKVLPSVIIKTTLNKKQLLEKLDKPLKQIAFLEDSNLFLVEVKDSLTYAKELEKKDFIIYAQPNILQQKVKNSFKATNIVSDFNLKKLWKNTKGEGVNIAIIDDGFDLVHEDLKGVNVLFSYDSDNKNLNSSPKLKIDNHGTQVAGIIFAQHNSVGVNGIAPEANLIAIRQTTNTTSDTIISFTVSKKAGADIINCSWNSPVLLEPIYDVIKSISKDTAVVFAAGNDSRKIESFSTEASIPEVITIGTNKKYSNYGDVVDTILPTNIKTTKINNNYGNFGGTSASAPLFSGLLALKISQNPNEKIETLIINLKKELNGRY